MMIFYVFCIVFSAYILHWLFIDLGMDFGITFDICLIPFPFAHALCKTFKNIMFIMNLYVFTHQEHMNVDDRFITNLGIDL